MEEHNESERNLGILAQEVLGRIISDPDFRQRFLDKSAALEGEMAPTDGDDVTGYRMPRNLIVDPMKAALGADLELLRPLKLWLDVCRSMGILHTNPTTTSGPGPIEDRQRQPVSDRPSSC
jgi:hypothetical protein